MIPRLAPRARLDEVAAARAQMVRVEGAAGRVAHAHVGHKVLVVLLREAGGRIQAAGAADDAAAGLALVGGGGLRLPGRRMLGRKSRAVGDVAVDGGAKVYMGIGVDAPRTRPETATCSKDIVYRSVMATYKAGGHGIVLSPNYASMHLKHLDGVAEALEELGLR